MSYNYEPEFHELLPLLPPLDVADPENIAAARQSVGEMTAAMTAELDATGLPKYGVN